MPATETQGVSDALWPEIIPFGNQDMDYSMGPDGGTMVRSYLVPWSLPWQQVAWQFIGYPYTENISNPSGDSIVTMRRHLPQTIEYMLNFSNSDISGFMYATDLKIQPLGGQGFLTTNEILKNYPQHYRDWDYAIFHVTYKTLAYDVYTAEEIEGGDVLVEFPDGPVEANRYVDWQDNDNLKFAQVDKAAWVMDVAGSQQAVGNKLGIPYPEGSVTLTWFDVAPGAFWVDYARLLEGRTNDDQFYDYAPSTLIFTGFKRRRRRNPLGNRTYNIEFNFLFKPGGLGPNNTTDSIVGGVNYFLDNSGVWHLIYNQALGTAVQPIKTGDFSNLFKGPVA